MLIGKGGKAFLCLPEAESGCYNWRVKHPEKTVPGENMKLSREEVLHIARLARVALTEAEITRLSEQLSKLLEHFEVLQKVDTEGVPPTAQSVELRSVMREDVVVPSLPAEDVLANAPRREGDSFRVRAVLE
jgi:aspartyl-tRNA(Asn)/glutamyl-tRNA(Gln) amidotransferase subunit C